MKYCFEVADVSIIFRDNKIISITLRFGAKDSNGNYPYKIHFHDSLQKLPVASFSRRDLAISFKLDSKKGVFPFDFVNLANLNYVGPIPAMTYFPIGSFKNISEYMAFVAANYPSGIFNLKEEAIKYCLMDCKALLKIMNAFTNLLFNAFEVDISKTTTLPGISFKLFRKRFFAQAKGLIPKFKYGDFLNLSKAFTGGATDLYIPTNLDLSSVIAKAMPLTLEQINQLPILERLYLYDFNSLFPYILMAFGLPCGKVTEFIGNIWLREPEAIGFFFVLLKLVEAPLNLKHPILQVKRLINGNLMTISPVGRFSGWFYSKELQEAIKLGYRIEVIKGYIFEKEAILFEDYIKFLYKMRLEYDKGDALNLIAKLLMNSLYGRFAMNPVYPTTKIMSSDQFNDFMNNSDVSRVVDFKQFANGFYSVTFQPNITQLLNNNAPLRADVSISISAAVTALSRIMMSQFKNHPKINIYYTDVDSIIINLSPTQLTELFPNILAALAEDIGQLKLEHVIEKAVFLAPKCYFLETIDGKQIIKIKGLNQGNILDNKKLSLVDFVNLLVKDNNLMLKQKVWFKNREESSINIIEQAYNLQVNENKRNLIFNHSGLFIGTTPFVLNEVPVYIDPAIIKTNIIKY